MRLGLVQFDVFPNECLENGVRKVSADVRENLLGELRPAIEKRCDNATNFQTRVI